MWQQGYMAAGTPGGNLHHNDLLAPENIITKSLGDVQDRPVSRSFLHFNKAD